MGDACDVLSLKWERHNATFLSVLTALKMKGVFSDVSVVCGGRVFPAHKLVLAASSPYFQHILAQLPTTRVQQSVVLVLQDICPEDFGSLLDYMYLGEASVLQRDLARLIQASEKLRIRGLAVTDSAEEVTKDNEDMCSGGGNSRGITFLSPPPHRDIARNAKRKARPNETLDDAPEDGGKRRRGYDASNGSEATADCDEQNREGQSSGGEGSPVRVTEFKEGAAEKESKALTNQKCLTPDDLHIIIKHERIEEDTAEMRTANRGAFITSEAVVREDGDKHTDGDDEEEEEEEEEDQEEEDSAIWEASESAESTSHALFRLGAFNGVLFPNKSPGVVPRAWLSEAAVGPSLPPPLPGTFQCTLPPQDGDPPLELLAERNAKAEDTWTRCSVTVLVTAKNYQSCVRRLNRALSQNADAAVASSEDEASDDLCKDRKHGHHERTERNKNNEVESAVSTEVFMKEMRLKMCSLRSELKNLKALLGINSNRHVSLSGSYNTAHDTRYLVADTSSHCRQSGVDDSGELKMRHPATASDVPPPPATTVRELDMIVDHPNVMSTLLSATSLAGGKIQEAVKSVLQRLMTRDLALSFSFTGMGRRRQYCKLCFKDHRAYSLAFSALTQSLPDQSPKEINDRLKLTLRQACDWSGGRGSRKRNLPDPNSALSLDYASPPNYGMSASSTSSFGGEQQNGSRRSSSSHEGQAAGGRHLQDCDSQQQHSSPTTDNYGGHKEQCGTRGYGAPRRNEFGSGGGGSEHHPLMEPRDGTHFLHSLFDE